MKRTRLDKLERITGYIIIFGSMAAVLYFAVWWIYRLQGN